MPHKYCRYCSHCFEGDVYYCSELNKELHSITHAVNCPDFALSELGDVITGKQYSPRKQVPIYEEGKQLTLDERSNQNE